MIDTILGDLKVIDVTSMIAGPTSTRFLAELGANVIHVEPPRGDDGRNSGPPFLGRETPIFSATNRSKRSIVLDLKRPEGLEVMRQLVRDADIFVENAMPGGMDKLGLGYDALSELNPRLVYVSISGWGRKGPRAHAPGYDVLIQGYVGAMKQASAELPPQFNGSYIGDPTSPIVAAFATMVALRRREQTGRGGHVTTSLLEAAMDNIATRLVLPEEDPEPGGRASGAVTGGLSVFPCSDGRYAVICAWTDAQFEKLCRLADMPYLLDDPKFGTRVGRAAQGAAINEIIGHWTSARTCAELIDLLERENIPCSPVRPDGLRELLQDPQVIANELAVPVDHPTKGRIWLSAPPFRIDGERGAVRPAPLQGQHTDEILREHGLGDEAIAGLHEQQVIA
jgi:crotonobetainyl-CoA:carnitine CoA-transferase CaiB-like acyl-CoA transferase